MKGNFEADLEGAKEKLKTALSEHFQAEGYVVFDLSFERKPNRPKREDWFGYRLEFKLLSQEQYEKLSEPSAKSREAAVTGPGQKRVFSIDFSCHEYTEPKVEYELNDYPVFAYRPSGHDLNAEAILLCESDGTAEEVADEIDRINTIMKSSGATGIRTSRSEAERLSFWAGRKAAFPAAGRISADYFCMDGTIPRRRLGEMLLAIQAMERKYQLRCINVFHAGDGNLHPLILFDANVGDELARAEAFGGEILELSVSLGGTITGEHGVGVEKVGHMCAQFSDLERNTFFRVKAAFDPDGLLNPGKAVPTLNRCAEFGHMHVKGGQLPHPDIERF